MKTFAKFSLKPSLWRHIQTLNETSERAGVHEGYKGHKCASCGKTFHTAPYLKKHVFTVHEGDKDHKCKSCDERR